MRRSTLGLAEIADWHNLASAFYRAARGSADNAAVAGFRANLERELASLRRELLSEQVSLGQATAFYIRDPKPRLIHAPCFGERVLHHAVMAKVGPILDKALVDDCFACRVGKGALAAVRRCQHFSRRYPWFVQIDIRAYFASIDHQVLLRLLAGKFKDPALLRLFEHIVAAYQSTPGKGLPIGALTSQHFANFYLAGLDRKLTGVGAVRGFVRYMDDSVWWVGHRSDAQVTLKRAVDFLNSELQLSVKTPCRLGRTRDGLTFCGYRVRPGAILLTRRRKRRYAQRRRHWETAFRKGHIDAATLQRNYASVLGMVEHASSTGWRREQLRRAPLAESLDDI